jgi:hypothetical protein
MKLHKFEVHRGIYFPNTLKKFLRLIVLHQELQKYLDEAPDGVIYFSMGSNLQSHLMSESKKMLSWERSRN